jgi:hypothetical protein
MDCSALSYGLIPAASKGNDHRRGKLELGTIASKHFEGRFFDRF